jgi:type I restriction enzyme, S subunit
MSSEWSILKIEDIAERVGMGPFGSSIKVETFVESGIPIISGEHLHDITLTEKKFRFITEQHATQLVKSNVFRGDVVFTHAGTIGQVSVIPEDSKYVKYILSQRQFFMRCNKELVNPLYVAYFFKSPQGRHKLLANASQVGVPSIARPVTYLRSIEIPVPPLAIQNQIVSVIESMRDRITLLRETNATLEAIAQALFKSWFVDFDPVRAKSEGKLAEGMDEATAALFTDSFQHSELGEIPKGWNIGNLGDIFTLRNERTKPSNQTFLLPYVPTESIDFKMLFLNTFKSGNEANSSLILFKEGDILFGAMRPYFHKVCIAPFNGVTRTTVFTLTPKDYLSTAFALLQAFQEQTVSYATKHSEGSTIPYAKWKNSLEKMTIVIPNQGLQRKFSEIVMPLIKSGNENCSRSRTLANLRDTLLPRLISGQLRIVDAEAEIEKVSA